MTKRLYFLSPTSAGIGGTGGGSICTLAYLQAVAEAMPGAVTVIAPPDQAGLAALPRGVSDFVPIPARSAWSKAAELARGRSLDRMSPFVDRLLRSLDLSGSVFFMNGSRGGRFSATLRRAGVPTITLFHNVEERFYASMVRNPLMRAMLCRIADQNDRLAMRHSAVSIFLSEFDRQLMHRRACQEVSGALSIGNGYFSPRLPAPGRGTPEQPAKLLISCSLGISQNVPGILEFLRKCWEPGADDPRLQGVTLVIAGSSPAAEVRRAAAHQPRVRLVADPTPDEMTALFASCRACISTIDAGSGIKVRVAESLRHGRPVVATPHGAIGYESIDRRVLRVAPMHAMLEEIVDVIRWPHAGELERISHEEFDSKLAFESGSRRVAAWIRHASDSAGR